MENLFFKSIIRNNHLTTFNSIQKISNAFSIAYRNIKKIFEIIYPIFLLIFFWINSSYALSEQDAIDKYFSDRKILSFEGIWMNNNNNGVSVIYYDETSNQYVVEVIRHMYFQNGAITARLDKAGNTYHGDTYALEVFNNGKVKTHLGYGSFELITKNMITYSWSGKPGSFAEYYTRLWPENIDTHNLDNDNFSSKDDSEIIPAASGTGFFVSKSGNIITNYHVIENCSLVKVHFGGEEINAEVIANDRANDLAILKIGLKPNIIFPIANEDADLLEDIIVAGYPLGKKVSAAIKTSKGSVTALAGYGDNYSEFQIDAALNSGNSGGPIIDHKGNLVGVAVAVFGKQDGVESFNFGIKASTLKTFAKANGLKFKEPNKQKLSNKELGNLITNATVYIECHMTVANIRNSISNQSNQKAFFTEIK